jgi:DNA modification methylase
MPDDLADLPQPEYEGPVAVDALATDGDNPNEMTDEQFGLLCDRMRQNGWLGGPVVTNTDGLIADGEHRWRAAQDIGLSEVPVRQYDIDDAERRLWRQELNKIHGEHDAESDAIEFDRLLRDGKQDEVYDLFNATGDDLETLLDELDTGVELSDYSNPTDVANEPFEAECSPGDFIALGEHRLLCGDSTVSANVSAALEGDFADAVFTDPPFNISGSTTGLGDDVTDHALIAPFFNGMATALAENTRLTGHVYVCCDWRTYPLVWDTVGAEMSPKNLIVWDKEDAGLGANYQNQHELIAFLHNYSQEQTAKGETERPAISTTTGDPNVWTVGREQDKDIGDGMRDHFAMKPLELPKRAIENSTDYGDTVLDAFGGTGTTLTAAEQSGRKCVMLEADPSYCDTIIHRWEQKTGETARVLETPDGYVEHDPEELDTVGHEVNAADD